MEKKTKKKERPCKKINAFSLRDKLSRLVVKGRYEISVYVVSGDVYVTGEDRGEVVRFTKKHLKKYQLTHTYVTGMFTLNRVQKIEYERLGIVRVLIRSPKHDVVHQLGESLHSFYSSIYKK